MTDISEEKDMSRAKRRKNDWKKAIRKSRIVRKFWPNDPYGWYKHLHQYSKGKIHCSCPICAAKTNPKRKLISVGNTISDQRKIDEMNYETNEEAEGNE